MNKNSLITDELLARYLLGEATEAEKEMVQNWISESDENKNHYYELKLIWEQSANVAFSSTINENRAWGRFIQRTQQEPATVKVIPLSWQFNWLKIAALLLLLAGGSCLVYFLGRQNDPQDLTRSIAKVENPDITAPVNAVDANIQTGNTPHEAANTADTGHNGQNEMPANTVKTQTATNALAGRQKIYRKIARSVPNEDNRAKEFICNSTPCPIEICIVQSVKCKNSKESKISTCSILEPDQSGQIHYKANNKIGRNCSLNVEEITIRTVSTGETITLTADSKPTTAQDVFNYITGEKRGKIKAGKFYADCNNRSDEHSITLDNIFGDLRLQ